MPSTAVPASTLSSPKTYQGQHALLSTASAESQCQTSAKTIVCPTTTKTHPFGEQSQNAPPSSVRRVLIIGAGCSGLAAIKSCLDEGLLPVCLERSSDIGGLWNYTDNDRPGNAGIYRSLVINTSKEMMMFSDFPPPENFPPFLTHEKVLEYFRLYVKHFDLGRYIRFNAEVVRVSKADNYEATGKWRARYTWRKPGQRQRTCSDVDDDETHGMGNEVKGQVLDDVFDGVMICTGHHSVPYTPNIPGLAAFKGRAIHSRYYKESTAFLGKRIVVLGMGNSAVDIACDLAKSAKTIYLSSRRGAWIVPRTSVWGLPADMLANSRVVFTLPYRMLDWFVQVQANFRVDHDAYGLRPQHGVLNCHPTINDELPIHLVSGRVQTKPSIVGVLPDGVLVDGGEFLPCDVIIFATGYDYKVDFVDSEDLKVENNQSCLYKFMVPPHHPHPTLTVIGLIQAIGAVMPIAEIQTRWAAKLITGAVKLPSRSAMERDYEERRTVMARMYVDSRRHSMQTFWIDYMDQIARKIGAKPNLWKLLVTDPELALKCYFGPCLPAQYRLSGPNAWPKARDFILGVFSRASKAMPGSRVTSKKQQSGKIDQAYALESNDLGQKYSERIRNSEVSASEMECPGADLSQEDAGGVSCRSKLENFPANLSGTKELNGSETISSCHTTTLSKCTNTANVIVDEATKSYNEKANGPGFWRPSTEWMTFTFYIWAIIICFLAFGLVRSLGQQILF